MSVNNTDPSFKVTNSMKYVVNARFEVPVGDEKKPLDVTASVTVNVTRKFNNSLFPFRFL